MTEFKEANKKIQNEQNDKRLLRYLIVDADIVHSTAAPDPLGCHYIYVKPGLYNKEMRLSNIDFAQHVYAENGINLKKHISKLDNKETEVLFIGVSDEAKLPHAAQDFLEQTAPCYMGAATRARDTELCNKLYRIKNNVNNNNGNSGR